MRDVAVGEPVFLTKNGRIRYAVLDIEEYEKINASLKLLSMLAQGEREGNERGWISPKEVEAELSKK